MKLPVGLPVLVAAGLLAGACGDLSAQEAPDAVGDTATALITVEGEVLDGLTGRPLSGVLVALHDLWKLTWTDELGYFKFDDVPQAAHELGVYGLGYVSYEEYLELRPREILAVKLDPAPFEMEEITVEVLSKEELDFRSYGQRYDFIGPELMEEYRVKYGAVADMLRARFPAVRVVDRGGPAQPICVQQTRLRPSLYQESAGGCATMYVDGLEADGASVAELHPDDIESIRYLPRIEALLMYGSKGQYGVLLIETRTGGRRR